MKYIKFSFFLLSTLLSSFIFSQTKTSNTFGSAGNTFRSSELIMDFTMGEVFTQTFTNKGITLTQGQHQQEKVILTASKAIVLDFSGEHEIDLKQPKLEISAFPNPFQSNVTIQLSQDVNLSYTIFNTQGQLISSGNLSDLNNKFDLEHLITGTYYFVYQTDSNVGQISLIKL